MRTIVAITVLLAVGLVGIFQASALAQSPPVYTPVGPGDIYLALGDSLSTGDEEPTNSASEGNLPGYPAIIAERLTQTQPISFTLLGKSGETSSSLRTPGGQLDQAVNFITTQRAAGKRVSPVTLSIGGNDIIGVLLGGSLTVTDTVSLVRTNLEQSLDALQTALDGDGDLIVMNYYNPYPGFTLRSLPPFIVLPPGQEPIVTERDVQRFNAMLAEVAAARGIPVVDAYSAFVGREGELTFVRFPIQLSLDQAQNRINLDYHPRFAGHTVLAEGFLSASQYDLRAPGNQLWLPLTVNP
jgi:lysophospholipase L1-like esterase